MSMSDPTTVVIRPTLRPYSSRASSSVTLGMKVYAPTTQTYPPSTRSSTLHCAADHAARGLLDRAVERRTAARSDDESVGAERRYHARPSAKHKLDVDGDTFDALLEKPPHIGAQRAPAVRVRRLGLTFDGRREPREREGLPVDRRARLDERRGCAKGAVLECGAQHRRVRASRWDDRACRTRDTA